MDLESLLIDVLSELRDMNAKLDVVNDNLLSMQGGYTSMSDICDKLKEIEETTSNIYYKD